MSDVRPAFGCGRYLAAVALRDERVWVLDADLADSDGAEAFAKRMPHRFIQAGIAEQNMVTMAAGMAACGARPFVFSFAAFLCYRAADQIRVALAQASLPVTLVGSHSGGLGGPNGKTHQALNDVAFLSSLPNIDIWAPADDSDTEFAIDTILRRNRPAYLRYPREPLCPLSGTSGLCRRFGPESSRVLITSGYFVHIALDVQRYLATLGRDLLVIQCLRLAPLPVEDLKHHLGTYNRIWVLDDHSAMGGLASILLTAGFPVTNPVFAWPHHWSGGHGTVEELTQQHGLTPLAIATQMVDSWAA